MVSVSGGIPENLRRHYPFASRFYDTGGARMHYVDVGEGRPIVMLHGNPTWSFYYRRLMRALSPRMRVIAPDHIGCGLSDKPRDYAYTLATHIENLGKLLENLAVGELDLVLHDWGGAIGMGWAIKNPNRVRRIIVLNTAAFHSARVPLRIAACRIPVFGEFAVRGLNAFAGAALALAVNHRGRMTPEIRRGYLFPYDCWENRIALHRFVMDIPNAPQAKSFPVLDEIDRNLRRLRSKPLLLQWGALDWCFTTDFLKRWLRRFPGAEADVYADAGHYVLEDAHERIIPRVRSFLGIEGSQ